VCVCACVCVCVRACVRACVCACVCASVKIYTKNGRDRSRCLDVLHAALTPWRMPRCDRSVRFSTGALGGCLLRGAGLIFVFVLVRVRICVCANGSELWRSSIMAQSCCPSTITCPSTANHRSHAGYLRSKWAQSMSTAYIRRYH
jgi:hypothetical protein